MTRWARGYWCGCEDPLDEFEDENEEYTPPDRFGVGDTDQE